jgi:hypothetical protein
MVIKFTHIFLCNTLQNLPKIGFFGLKIFHLATLGDTQKKMVNNKSVKFLLLGEFAREINFPKKFDF